MTGNLSAFDVLCGQRAPGQLAVTRLQHLGDQYDPGAATKVILDIQRGFALRHWRS